jgi:hypothetical protein
MGDDKRRPRRSVAVTANVEAIDIAVLLRHFGRV